MGDGWTIHAEAAGDPGGFTDDQAAALAEHLGGAAAVSFDTDHSRYGATWSHRDHPQQLSDIGIRAEIDFGMARRKAGLPSYELVRLEVVTFDEHDRDLERPTIPELVGVTEIAGMLGVSRQRVTQLEARDDFPAPITRLAATPVWTRDSVKAFTETWARKNGRPPKDVPVA